METVKAFAMCMAAAALIGCSQKQPAQLQKDDLNAKMTEGRKWKP